MTPQAKGLLIVVGLAALAGLIYLGATELPGLISPKAPEASQQAAAAPATQELKQLQQENAAFREQMTRMEQLIQGLQEAIAESDGKKQAELAGQIQQLQNELAKTRQQLAALQQARKEPAPSQAQRPEPQKPAQPAPSKEQLAKAKDEGRTEGAAVALAIAGGILLLCQIADCSGQAAQVGQRPPEQPTPVTEQRQPPQLYSDTQCAEWSRAPQAQERVSFTARMPNAGKLVVVADTRWGRGFFRCMAFTMSPQAQERFLQIWPGQTLPGPIYARCYQYANRSECVFRTEILELYDKAWIFGLDSSVKLHWSSQELQVARFN